MTQRVIARIHPVHMMNAEQRQMAADLWTKLTGLRFETRKLHSPLLFIINQHKSCYHLREGGRLSRPRWLVTYRDDLPARVGSNQAQCSIAPAHGRMVLS